MRRFVCLCVAAAFPAFAAVAQPSSVIVPDSARSSGMSRQEAPGSGPPDQRVLNQRSDRIGRLRELESNPRPLDGAQERELRRLRDEVGRIDSGRRLPAVTAPSAERE